MLSFDDYKKKTNGIDTIGKQLKVMADEAMQETFDNSIGTKQCYLYDYYHDDQPELEYGYNPALSKTKIPVKLKFIIKSYKSMSSDDPEYHIMFEPNVWNSMSCKPDWFDKGYSRLGIEFPVGLFFDIADDRGVYHKWICTYVEVANQFVKCGVLRCNYRFQWIENDGTHRYKRKMWGVNSSQSSYTSGIWLDQKSQSYDNQDLFYLPWNPISSELRHDTRLCISMLRKEPFTYKITKVDDTTPKGLITFTVKQDKFEPEHDYVQLDMNKDDYGDMYPDYWDSNVLPKQDEENLECKGYRLSIEAPNYEIKLGNSKVLTAKIYDAEDVDITDMFKGSECIWTFKMDDKNLSSEDLIVVDESYGLKEGNEFKSKFKFNGDEQYLRNNIIVTCQIDDLSANVTLDIVAL